MNQKYFYFDQNVCTGCDTCVVACKDWNDIEGTMSFRNRTTTEKGSFPNMEVYQVLHACQHCEEPACVNVCPVMAIVKQQDTGAVIVDEQLCIGCRGCKGACPYDAPQFVQDDYDARMKKCTMCWDRLNADIAKNGATSNLPACVAACPQRALKFGTLEELAGQGVTDFEKNVVGFAYDTITKPAIRFKRKQKQEKTNSFFK